MDIYTVLKTDTGKQVENTKACEKTKLKELCKITAVTSGESGSLLALAYEGII